MRHAHWEPTDTPNENTRKRFVQLCELVLDQAEHEVDCFINRHAGKNISFICDCDPTHEVRELFHDPVAQLYYTCVITTKGASWLVAKEQ